MLVSPPLIVAENKYVNKYKIFISLPNYFVAMALAPQDVALVLLDSGLPQSPSESRPTSDATAATPPSTLEEDFREFTAERNAEKERLYQSVFAYGGRLVLSGFIVAAVLIFTEGPLWASSGQGTRAAITAFILAAELVCCVGFIMITSVPTNEHCLDTWLNSSLRSKGILRVSIGLLTMAIGLYVIVFLIPYVSGLPALCYGIWTLAVMTTGERGHWCRCCE